MCLDHSVGSSINDSMLNMDVEHKVREFCQELCTGILAMKERCSAILVISHSREMQHVDFKKYMR